MDNIFVPPDRLIISIDELKAAGWSQYKINQLVKNGSLIKLNKRFYENAAYRGEPSDYYYAYAYVPNGVICLLSAASYYDLTAYRPDAVDVAIPRKANVSTLPDWPAIRLHHFTDFRFAAGIVTVEEAGSRFRIYNIEKTVADIVYYRDTVGIEETKEVLVNYLLRSDRDLNRLVRCAQDMKCGDIMQKYLEVLV